MFKLTSVFDDSFEYEGKRLTLQLAFDNVLRMFELLQDPFFTHTEKIDIALEILIIQYDKYIYNKSIEEKFALFSYILKEFLDIDINKQEEPAAAPDEEPAAPPKKTYDFIQDAGIIYASFFNAYNLDLFEQQGKLHWKKFLQLLLNLGDKSKFKEVIHIRTMKLPKADKYNAEYRADIMRAKRYYELKDMRSDAEKVAELNDKLNAIANMLKK